MTDDPARQPLIDEILDLFAKEARVERSRLLPDLRADELGATSLDIAMALFAMEDRFDVHLPEVAPGDTAPTVRQMVQQVLDAIDRRTGTAGALADTLDPGRALS